MSDGRSRLIGEQALPAVLDRLASFEAPAYLWEADLLPSRLAGYDPPAWTVGVATAYSDGTPSEGGAPALRLVPVTLIRRQDSAHWEALTANTEPAQALSRAAEAVNAALASGGALFFDALLARLRLLPSQIEAAIAGLAGLGMAFCDGFADARALGSRGPPSDARRTGGADGRRGLLVLGPRTAR
ncbi:MAG: hypothetical protein ACREXW_18600 [Gammaproteobacteria bacterium]